MAAATVNTAAATVNTATAWSEPTVDKSLFPDGYKTSGMHAPVYSWVQPYEKFPKAITGPTVWTADEFKNNPEKWTYAFNESEIAEIEAAADKFIQDGHPLVGMTKDLFPLPHLAARLQVLRKTLVDGQGFWLFKNIPVREWGNKKCATAYMGLGSHLGYFTSQNGRGHVLGHVKDLGEVFEPDRVRVYRTNNRQFFHTDASDLVGLLCMAKAMEGGESDIVSMHHIFNILQRDYPDVAKLLCEPVWYFDRKGEVSEGQEPWIRGSVFYLENDPEGSPRVFGKFDPMNVNSLKRFNSGPDSKIPPPTEAHMHAMQVLEEVCLRESLHMILDPGDIQFLSNSQVFHARTAYKDYAPGSVDEQGKPLPRRHLMRLWLSVPLEEGGWKLPYPDYRLKKRGGIQVNDNPPTCPLDAE